MLTYIGRRHGCVVLAGWPAGAVVIPRVASGIEVFPDPGLRLVWWFVSEVV